MAITEAFSGTASITSTEWSATTNTAGPDAETSDGVFQGYFDLSDMITGDQIQLRVYEKARSSDAQLLLYESIISGAQAYPLMALPSLILMHGWDFTMKTLAGTSITVNWSIRKAA
jgi:hypothetical protein